MGFDAIGKPRRIAAGASWCQISSVFGLARGPWGYFWAASVAAT